MPRRPVACSPGPRTRGKRQIPVPREGFLRVEYGADGTVRVEVAVGGNIPGKPLSLRARIESGIPDVKPEPRAVTHVLSPAAWMSSVEINQCIGKAVSEYMIARAHVAVTHNFARAPQWRTDGCIVVSSEEPCRGGGLLIGKEPEIIRNLSRKIGENLTPTLIQSEKPRRRIETLSFQLLEQGVSILRVVSRRPSNGVTYLDDAGSNTAAGQRSSLVFHLTNFSP